MDALFNPLADAVGASVDQIKLISCLLFSYPLGSVFVRIPASQPWLKHIFNIAVTFFYIVMVLNLWSGFAQLLLSVLGTYFIARNVQGPKMPWIAFWFVMGHLTLNHAIRAIFNWSYETFEVTGPQMVLTMKLTTFAWNVYDGRRSAGELDKWQLEKRVVEYPSLLAFLGYSFYFPGFLVGPYLDYASYATLVDESVFTTAKGKEKESTGSRRIPKGRKRVAYRKLIVGLAFLGLYVTQIGKYNFEVVLQDWFLQKGLLYRLAFFQLCGFFERTKYYAIWTLTEGSSILTGLGFTGYGASGESLWNGAANVDIPNIEFGQTFKVMLDSWNMKTNVWLRECIYKRVTPPGKKPGFRSSMLTFLTSAFWHGVAGGYYLAFLTGGFAQTVGRLCRSGLRPLLLPATASLKPTPASKDTPPTSFVKRVYDVLGTLCTVMLMNYCAMPFMLLGVQKSLLGWAHIGWYGHFMIGGAMAFFYLGGGSYLNNLQTQRVKKVDLENKSKASLATPVTPGPMVVPPVDIALNGVNKKL